jgi:Domain of unknown function (DUF4214)
VRIQFLNKAQGLTSEEYVWIMYRTLLKREADEKGFRGYVDTLREGRLTREAMLGMFIASHEYRERPTKVLVVPNHPVFNGSTLRYYAELHRYPLAFFHIPWHVEQVKERSTVFEYPISRDQLQEYDFVLVKDGGYQRPDFTGLWYPVYGLTTQYNKPLYAELMRPESGFIPLAQTFAFPDHSHILIFAATYTFK